MNRRPIYILAYLHILWLFVFSCFNKKTQVGRKNDMTNKIIAEYGPYFKNTFFKKNFVSFMVFCYILRGWYFKLKISFHFSYWNLTPGTWPLASTWHLGTCCAPDTWFLPDTWNLRTWNLAPTFRNFCHDFNVFALRLFENSLKELRNYNRKLFLCPPQKQTKIQPNFWAAVFQNKLILWQINLNTYK